MMSQNIFFEKLIQLSTTKLFVFLLLSFLVSFTYAPSTEHFPRGDQWDYLLNTIDNHSVVDTLVSTYSYNRQREVGRGDTALFRPVLFFDLALQKGLFGSRNFALWQLMGIVLHIMVCFFLFLILQELSNKSNWLGNKLYSALPLTMTLFFALNPAMLEQIIWSHMSGYILFTLLFEIALYFILMALREGQRQARFLNIAVFVAFIAVFCYELGEALALGLALVLVFHPKTRSTTRLYQILFFAIPLIYFFINWMDQAHQAQNYVADMTLSSVLKKSLSFATVMNTLRAFSYTAIEPYFGLMAQITHGGFGLGLRLSIRETTSYMAAIKSPLGYLCATLLLTWLVGIALNIRNFPKRWSSYLFSISILGVYFFYLAFIVLGRMSFRDGPDVLNSYYPYIGFICFSLFLASMYFLPDITTPHRRLFDISVYIMMILQLSVSGFSIFKIRDELNKISLISKSFRDRIARTEEFINTLPSPRKIAFVIDPAVEMRWHGVNVEEILFRQETHRNPTFLVHIDKNLQITATENGNANVLYLEKPGDLFNTYSKDSLYYGIIFREDPKELTKKQFDFEIRGSTFSEVVRQIPLMTQKRKEDISSGKYLPPPGHVQLEEEGFHGFNIILTGGVYIAILQSDGGIDFERIRKKEYSKIFIGSTIDETKNKILIDLKKK